MKAAKVTTESPELADRFNRVLGEVVEALEEAGLQYVFIGGIASGGLGRPRSTHDIDVFVRPEDAELSLRALAKRGFRTEKTDPVWLYKGFKDNILVDIIFKSKGEIYLDNELWRRSITAEFHGKQLRLVSPEDLIIIKAAAHSELTPGHWHDALALLSHATVDWDYLIHRARRAPRRVLSLMLYAQSSDILVPKSAIDQLYRIVFGDLPTSIPQPQGRAVPSTAMSVGPQQQHSPNKPNLKLATPEPPRKADDYQVAHLREALATDPRTHELDIDIVQSGDKVLLRGEVMTSERRDAVIQLAREVCPGAQLENQIRVTEISAPGTGEDIR